MKHIIFTLYFCFITIITFGQSSSKDNLKYKPKTLDEAIVQLEKLHDDTTKQKIIAMTEREFIRNSHFGLGLWMRNNWGLWKRKELAKHFNSLGIFHPDDMSGIILTSYYRQLKGQDRKLDEQIKYYQEYWKSTNEHFNRLKTDTLYQKQIKKMQDSIRVAMFNEKKLKWSTGKKVSGYIDKRCDFMNDFLIRTRIEGTIVEWNNEKLVIKITKYDDEKLKKRLTKCHKIVDGVIVINDHELFRLEE